ncbi:excinuclease ABC subunit UvrA [Candidatus Palauibacter polyketidifaciens]|uniref:excinuclease ABC subunit UvrA n=1 Tax=Candidatus Palauibacter polyketidifaciens TaxID=3056740 RepID=UPI00238C0C80|nr:excinuclease ABC subunit UvrA [Candidatus Palauibacter polyketidifaciens]MDE2719978.1 excinuclease ABC subunit UvrA [Candidatus Palauibacter polyketidifaciens]
MSDRIRVRGARQHNLKGIDIDIERGALTVLTGPSGSGKSSLAFDTIYAEGQRRYIESLSTYAKQFLERMPKPDVDLVEGVSPSVAIDQSNRVQSSRSTVGTITEVYDYLRLLWARVGTTVCPECGRAVVPDTVTSATDALLDAGPEARLAIAFPIPREERTDAEMVVENLRARGYVRVLADGRELYLPDIDLKKEEEGEGDEVRVLTDAREALVIVDRVGSRAEDRERIADSLAAAFAEGRGAAVALLWWRGAGAPERRDFEEAHRCGLCGLAFPRPTPQLFSFNSPAGACDTCTGFGAVLEYSPQLIVPDPGRSLDEGALDPWSKPRYRRERSRLREFAAASGLDASLPWEALPDEGRDVLLNGGRYAGERFRGVIPFLRSKEKKRYKAYIRVFLRQYQLPELCSGCEGYRLKPESLNVRVGGRHIAEVARWTVKEISGWLAGGLDLTPFQREVASTILRELEHRTSFLEEVGLGYLTLDRQARSLSGGEMQRIRLASCLGSRLVSTLYVLDEPTIGLHSHDIHAFTGVLHRLANRGNTVLVVEHEPTVLERADRIVELGPGAGEQGGEIVFQGGWDDLLTSETGTGEALARRATAAGQGAAPSSGGPRLVLRGARLHNVRGVDVAIPLGSLTLVTGVSGSGKSTLIRGVLYHALEREITDRSSAKPHLGEPAGSWDRLEGAEFLEDVVLVDQRPIGRTPRSNPATYIGAFTALRNAYAALPEARSRGYEAGYFSFNRPGGRCERCKGAGEETVEMVFLADVSVPCEACGGSRYRPEVLEIGIRGRSIRDALDMTVDEAIRFFIRHDRLGARLWQLQRVGLGYLRLGQPATTLSGGEAQRLKIARELARRGGAGRRLYILDEPTVGLGVAEVGTLVAVLRELVGEGHAVVVVEHNLDVVAEADWVIDMGPGPAEDGGRIVAAGPPDVIAESGASLTGAFLRARAERLGLDAVVAGAGSA